MKLVYMAHPVRGDVVGNMAKALDWHMHLRQKYAGTHVVICPWLQELLEGADDSDEEQRVQALRACKRVIEVCDEIWFVGKVMSTGMSEELVHAHAHGVGVVHVKDRT